MPSPESSTPAAEAASSANGRWLGRLRGAGPGPTVVIVAGMHGNEPAGLAAIREVFGGLTGRESRLRGELVALAGNLTAIARGVRYVDADLNRLWTEPEVDRLDCAGPRSIEEGEQLGLLEALRSIARQAVGPFHLIDLHTSSADGPPFLTVGDTLRNRNWALGLPLPILLGIEEQIDGALLEFAGNRGALTLGVEAGRHDRRSSVERHCAVLWLALSRAGSIGEADLPDLERQKSTLVEASRGVPHVVEVRRRHAIVPQDEFKMLPDFRNFDPIETGQPLARDRSGAVCATERGLLLLPLYQGLGNDGFFTGREVRPAWLTVSRLLRRLRLAAVLPLLPGVRRLPGRPASLVVDRRVAQFWALEILHLLGYRKRRQHGKLLEVSRRRWDIEGPSRVEL